MNTVLVKHRLLRAVGGAYIIGSLACASLLAKDADASLSFERKEGFKPGVQAASEALSATEGTFSVVEGSAPQGDAFLQFEGKTADSLGLLTLPKRGSQSLAEMRFLLRAPFTDGGEDRDYLVAGGAVLGVAQTEQAILVSFPLDRSGDNWRELSLSRDLVLARLPADWSLFEVRRDPEGKRWDLLWNQRVLATGLPLASGLEADDFLAISGLGPVSIDDVQLDLVASAQPFSGDTSEHARKRALELRDQHRKSGKSVATDAKGRRGPAWGRAADPGATTVGEAKAASISGHLELFLPKP